MHVKLFFSHVLWQWLNMFKREKNFYTTLHILAIGIVINNFPIKLHRNCMVYNQYPYIPI